MQRGRFLKWFVILVLEVCFLKTEALLANITYVESAVTKGAVCLDGSPPAYHFDKGFGAGINNWLVHIEGGGWCNNVTSCLARKNTKLGSSKLMVKQLAFSGILTNRKKYNPDFYNWNRVKVGYCDGSSFTGDIEAVNPATNLHFRGAKIFVAVVMDLLARGMKNAENALLSGCSAGGLTSIIHCDSFQALLPMGTKVKCLSDAGFFLNTEDVSGAHRIEAYFKDVVTTHGSTKNLPLSCTSVMSNPHLCFFPRNLAKQIQTPLFILNAAYDSWQIRNILAPDIADPYGFWRNCKRNFTCSSTQLKTLQDFRLEYIWDISNLGKSIARGLFINSCFAHCQTETQETWFMPNSPSLDGIRIATAIGDWFNDRKPFQKIDCPFPCDKTCHNRIYEHEYEIA